MGRCMLGVFFQEHSPVLLCCYSALAFTAEDWLVRRRRGAGTDRKGTEAPSPPVGSDSPFQLAHSSMWATDSPHWRGGQHLFLFLTTVQNDSFSQHSIELLLSQSTFQPTSAAQLLHGKSHVQALGNYFPGYALCHLAVTHRASIIWSYMICDSSCHFIEGKQVLTKATRAKLP